MEELSVWSRGRGPAQHPSRASTSIKKKLVLCVDQEPRGRGPAAAKGVRVASSKGKNAAQNLVVLLPQQKRYNNTIVINN